jgi:hypothetical protein
MTPASSDRVAVALLSESDLRAFARDGFLLVPNVVPEDLLTLADREVDDFIATTPPDDGDASAPGQHGWFPPVRRLPRCDDLLRASPAIHIAQELVAPDRLEHRFDHIQIATTTPGWSHIPGGPHIDGHGPGQDPPFSFTLLAGVLLTDQRASQSGNLWVWPGSHLEHEKLFRDRGTRILLETGGHATALEPPPTLGPPIEILGDRGDLLLAHFLLGHNKGGNTNDHIRRTIYYRLAVPGHPARWHSTFLDAFAEYAPVRRAFDAMQREKPCASR